MVALPIRGGGGVPKKSLAPSPKVRKWGDQPKQRLGPRNPSPCLKRQSRRPRPKPKLNRPSVWSCLMVIQPTMPRVDVLWVVRDAVMQHWAAQRAKTQITNPKKNVGRDDLDGNKLFHVLFANLVEVRMLTSKLFLLPWGTSILCLSIPISKYLRVYNGLILVWLDS